MNTDANDNQIVATAALVPFMRALGAASQDIVTLSSIESRVFIKRRGNDLIVAVTTDKVCVLILDSSDNTVVAIPAVKRNDVGAVTGGDPVSTAQRADYVVTAAGMDKIVTIRADDDIVASGSRDYTGTDNGGLAMEARQLGLGLARSERSPNEDTRDNHGNYDSEVFIAFHPM